MLRDKKQIVEKPIPRSIEIDRAPEVVARGLRHLPGLIFLDSSAQGESTRAISIIAAKPVDRIVGSIFSDEDQEKLRAAILANDPGNRFPDFGFPCGGLVGAVNYDGAFEFGVYPEMLIFDHARETWFEVGRLSDEINCLAELESRPEGRFDFRDGMSKAEFCEIVDRAQEYIAAGDIYQVNLAHQLWTEISEDDIELFGLFDRMRDVSPAPYSGFFALASRTILSTSPEQFLRLSGSAIQTRPIKGTRPRFRDREQDEKSAYDLRTSPKEVAELIMITDLERNDLGQVCEIGSVEAVDLLKLERFEHVFHLVSTVRGNLRPEVDHVGALAACFPGGSITGAPKKRAREIIAELEPVSRGLYTGALGVFGFNGESRFNIAIRTVVVEGGALHFHVGAGIVAESSAEAEWEETLHKAAGILGALG